MTSQVVYVVSAPSGTGKTTLNRRLIKEHANIQMSVSYTTRKKRINETDGIDYHFVSEEKFRELIKAGQMLEYAEVFGTLYGTSFAEIVRIQSQNKIALLEIDVQGWRQAREKIDTSKSIFILPPSVEELWQRLELRGTESKDVRWRRLMTARAEISNGSLYETFLINRDLESAYTELQAIIIQGKNPTVTKTQGVAYCQELLAEFDNAGWIQKLAKELADK